ncbi:MAG: IPExxxVDY family protein [Prevotellaceae bacterium]|nr:IPExxxVDY family protein [Prevotellaceae bacterium]
MAKKTKIAKKVRAARMKDFVEDSDGFSLLAICSAEPDVRMAWLLNRALHLDFVRRTPDLCGREPDEWQQQRTPLDGEKPEQAQLFAVFCAVSSVLRRTYILVTNRQGGELLIKELANVDYLLKIQEALPDDELTALGEAIRNIPDVPACIVITDDKIKSNPLLASLEV